MKWIWNGEIQVSTDFVLYSYKYLSKKDEDSYIKTSVSRVGNEKAKNSKGNTTSYRIEEEL